MNVKILGSVGDNYIYVLGNGHAVMVVDPAAAGPVLALLDERACELAAVVVTHDHSDHTGGCAELRAATGCQVVGPAGARVPACTRTVRDGERVSAGGVNLEVMAVPGHTASHVAYRAGAGGAVFTGDALFVAGCGRIIGASATEFWASLLKLRGLPDRTRVYCGHDYTLDNLEFALSLEPEGDAVRARLAEMRVRAERGEPTVPSTIAAERATNPFLRADDPVMQQAVGMAGRDAAEVFAEIRGRKDRWG